MCHFLRTMYIRFRLQMVHQPIVERVRGFGCAIYVGKFLTRHVAPVFMIERFWQRAIKILQVENQATQ